MGDEAMSSGSTSPEVSGALVVLCGRSFSGKSTAARWLQQSLPAEVISLDAINAERGLHSGEGIALEEWGRTYEEATQRAAAALRAGGTVVIDDTSSPRFLREGWREVAHRVSARFVLVYLDIDLETLRSRLVGNRGRPERPDVIDAVMSEHLATFEPPQRDEEALTPSPDVSADQLAAAVRQLLART